jgi:hypothetical protein
MYTYTYMYALNIYICIYIGKNRTGVTDFVESLQANTLAMNAKTINIYIYLQIHVCKYTYIYIYIYIYICLYIYDT